jgi:hypothetical protein
MICDQIQDIIKVAHIHSSNIPGMEAYWKSVYFEFKARSFYQSYVNDQDITVFHTGSHAEFHDPYLRLLLAKYVQEISLDAENDTSYFDILNDDDTFTDAVKCCYSLSCIKDGNLDESIHEAGVWFVGRKHINGVC